MKLYFLAFSLLASATSFTQTSSVSIRQNFNEISKLGRLQGGEGLQNFSSNNVKGSRYFPLDWEAGSIMTMSGEKMESTYLLLFDKQNHDLHVKDRNSAQVVLLDKNQVAYFSIGAHTFVSGAKLGADPEKYYELLSGNVNTIALYKLTATKFIKADKQDAERIKRGDFDDEFRDEITYLIKTANEPLKKIKLNQNSLIKALPEQSTKIKSYVNSHQDSETNETYFKNLVNYISQ